MSKLFSIEFGEGFEWDKKKKKKGVDKDKV